VSTPSEEKAARVVSLGACHVPVDLARGLRATRPTLAACSLPPLREGSFAKTPIHVRGADSRRRAFHARLAAPHSRRGRSDGIAMPFVMLGAAG
jgi:hypothetical protein